MPDRIYLDHAATTPILPEAAAAMAEACTRWANPSSPHAEGRAARAALEDARARIAAALGWDGTLIFTSRRDRGDRDRLAPRQGRARASSPRSSIRRCFAARARRAPDRCRWRDGTLDLRRRSTRALAGAERPLVAVQSVNNETGRRSTRSRTSRAQVKAAGGLLLADCAQSAGKLPLPDADFLVVAAHKLGGPPGIGALLVKDPAMLEAVGGQEGGYRPGTAAVPGASWASPPRSRPTTAGTRRRSGLRARLDAGIAAAGGEVVAEAAPRIATIACYRMPGVPAAAQMMQLDLAGIAVSAGSACSSGSLKTSHVLTAMGVERGGGARGRSASASARTPAEADIDALLADAGASPTSRRRAA